MTWQLAPILYPDAELVLTSALRPLLETGGQAEVEVDRRVPNPLPDRLVALTRDGGNSANLRDRPRIRVRVFDVDYESAMTLARMVVALIPRLVQNGTVLRAEHLSGPYEVPDDSPATQIYLLYEFHLRGTQLT